MSPHLDVATTAAIVRSSPESGPAQQRHIERDEVMDKTGSCRTPDDARAAPAVLPHPMRGWPRRRGRARLRPPKAKTREQPQHFCPGRRPEAAASPAATCRSWRAWGPGHPPNMRDLALGPPRTARSTVWRRLFGPLEPW